MSLTAGGTGIALLIAACSSDDKTSDGGAGTGALPSGGTAGGERSSGTGGAPSPSAGSSAAGMPSATAGSLGAGAPGVAGTSSTAGSGSGTAGAGAASGVAGASSSGAGGGASTAGASGSGAGTAGAGSCPAAAQLEKFSFFVTSYKALQVLSGKTEGFGGDLRYNQPDGLSGADKICTEIAERSMKCAGTKQWKAFLSVTKGPSGGPIHAIDRVGEGPWYDRVGRIVAMNKAALLNQRPMGADPAILNDLPNEDGIPNHAPDGMLVDNHDMLTGTNDKGQLYTVRADPLESTCKDWTSAERWGGPRVGHPWPTGTGKGGVPGGFGGGFGGPGGGGGPGGPGSGIGDLANWMSALDEAGCAPGASLVEMGPPNPNNPTVGSGGGYGGFYCFALTP